MDPSSKKLDRDALVSLVNQIMTSSGCMMDVDGLIATFEKNVPYANAGELIFCLLYTSPSPRDQRGSRMPSSA